MTCGNCGQPTAYISRSSRAFGKGNTLLVVENVPVIACHECGAEFLSITTFGQIERLKRDRASLVTRQIPVVSFQDEEDPALAELAEATA